MDNNTPLSKFKRQPKLYIDLPSKGIWYPKGKLNKFEEMEVYSMTANDEIAIKTPDALYTGQAITKVIQSCVPDILDPWLVPMTDIDYILASIRLASYGQDIQLSSTCKECGNEDNYTMEIQRILDFVQTLTLEEVLTIQDFKFYLRPLTYKEYTQIQQSNIQLQRTLYQSVSKMDEGDEKQKELDNLYEQLNDITKFAVCSTIIRVETPDGDSEDNPQFIKEFLLDGDKDLFNAVRDTYMDNQARSKMDPVEVKCSECGADNVTAPNLDYASFFAVA